jgi:hypothetical protein
LSGDLRSATDFFVALLAKFSSCITLSFVPSLSFSVDYRNKSDARRKLCQQSNKKVCGAAQISAQSDNNPTIVDQVIVLGASVGTLRYSSGVSRVYFVNLYSSTPLPL